MSPVTPDYIKKWRKDNVEYCKRYRKKQYDSNREWYLLKNYQRKDRVRNREFNLTIDWFIDNIIKKSCFYCGDTFNLGCDRIDNTKGHTKDNVIPCCENCNRGRGDLTIEEYKNHIKKQYLFLKLTNLIPPSV